MIRCMVTLYSNDVVTPKKEIAFVDLAAVPRAGDRIILDLGLHLTAWPDGSLIDGEIAFVRWSDRPINHYGSRVALHVKTSADLSAYG